VGHLNVADFEALLDNNPEILHVELSNYGEMFLNPHLPELFAAAYRRKVVVSGNNGVNLNFARDETLEAVVQYRVRSLTCSIDGATQATYSKYRRNGNIDNVLKHIDIILDYKRRFHTAFPILYWQFVVFGHNEHELGMARSMAKDRGMEFVPRLSWDADHSPLHDPELITIQTGLGAATRQQYKEKNGVDYTRNLCYQLWHAPVVNWDGKLLGCCVNYWGDFGSNVFTEGLAKSTESPRMDQARRMLLGQSSAMPDIPCSTCDQYHSLRESGRWLTELEIASHPKQQYIVSIVPIAGPEMRFARFAIYAIDRQEDGRSAKDTGRVGRLFRFGVDNNVFCSTLGPGKYKADADILTPKGWRRYTLPFTTPERPICHELIFDFNASQPAAYEREAGPWNELLTSWIR
jgi:hypothetical protein